MQKFGFITVLNKSSLDKSSAHSFILNVLRGIAALQVCVHHFRNHFFPSFSDVVDPGFIFKLFAFATGFANHAVMIFFAISGWLVGGSVLNNIRKNNFAINYAIDRISRLWTVLIPVFIISLLIVLAVQNLNFLYKDVFMGSPSIGALTFVGNLLGLQTIFIDRYAANYPLWSLANETAYYLTFPLLVGLFVPAFSFKVKAVLCAALLLVLGYLPTEIIIFASVWLLGALFSRIQIQTNLCGKFALLMLSLGFMLWGRYKNMHDDIYIILLYIVPLMAYLSANLTDTPTAIKQNKLLQKVVHFLSEISFSLYVLHVPFIYLFQSFYTGVTGQKLLNLNVNGALVFAAMIVLTLLFTYMFYRLFENQHVPLRQYLKHKILK
jgi:peptidoglycan/LPS O-acetylase OafA/YrhL